MRAFPRDRDVQFAACDAMRRLGVDALHGSEFAKAGAPQLVCDALCGFSKDRDVQCAGIGALW
eukprot:48613-Eustigmatos_ZCMA.PRE.1